MTFLSQVLAGNPGSLVKSPDALGIESKSSLPDRDPAGEDALSSGQAERQIL
jgi:hypothetical protein